MMSWLNPRCRVPADPASLVRVRDGKEVDPHRVGVDPGTIPWIWDAVVRYYATGLHPAISMCIRRRGEVILDRTSLEDAVREMNRYDRAALVLDDAAVAKLPISGIYRTGNNQDFAGAVAVVYGLEVRREDGEIHLRIR